MPIIYSIIFILLFQSIYCIKEPGVFNKKYKISSYYGSRYLSTYLASTYIEDDPVIVTWSDGLYLNEETPDILYIADSKKNIIKLIKDDVINIIIGEPYESGFRNGDAENARLNSPYAIVVFNSSNFPTSSEYIHKYKPILFSKDEAYFDKCKCANEKNYSECINNTANIYEIDRANNEDSKWDINHNLVKLINTNEKKDNSDISKREQYLFISDKGNHCIRKFDLKTAEISTYAGICGSRGFKDGPIGVNLFDSPEGIGIDSIGNLYVFDSGNRFMRMIDSKGYVKTLLNGSCFEYSLKLTVINPFSFKNKYLLCLRKWEKISGEPSLHIFNAQSEKICFDNIALCDGYYSEMNKLNENK